MQQIFWAKTRPNRGKMETGPAYMVVTADVFHAEMSGLHVSLPVVEPPPLTAHHEGDHEGE